MRCVKILLSSAVIALSFFSCLGIESSFTLNDNGSGRVAFQYRLSKMFLSLGKEEGGGSREEMPLPISKQELEKSLAQTKGVTVVSVEQTEDESDVYIKGEIKFDSVAALNKSGLFEDMPITLVKEGAKTTFTQLLTEAREPIDQETLDSYRGFFEGYEIALNITAPRPISASNRGALSGDKRTATYKISLNDFVRITEKTEWRVSW